MSGLDVLVLNAGISQRSLFNDLQFSTARQIMDINFTSYVALTKVLLFLYLGLLTLTQKITRKNLGYKQLARNHWQSCKNNILRL